MAHLAFERNPSNHLGVLRADNFAPLTLQGVVADVEIHDVTARLQLSFEYKNTTSSTQSAFVAFAQVPGWTLVAIRTESDHRWVRSVVGHDADRTMSAQPESDAFVATVATQSIPWDLLVHDLVKTTGVYYASVDVVGTGHINLTVPKSLFPRRVDVEDTARDYNAAFELKGIAGKLARTVYMHVHGALFDTLAQPPSIVSGENAVGQCNKNTFSAKWESHAHDLVVPNDLLFHAELQASPEPLRLNVWKDISARGSDDPKTLIPDAYMYAGTASLLPTLTTEQRAVVNDEMVFLLDASASMLPVWADVVRALKLAIAALPITTYVNVVWFSNDTEYLFPNGSELLTQTVRDLILEELLSFRLRTPSNGCTRLYQAIQSIYKQPYITGFVRNIVLITDSGAEEALAARCIDIARANVHSTRLSAVGVGATAHTTFLKMLSADGQGVFELAASCQDTAVALCRTISRVHVPTLVNVVARTEFNGEDTEGKPSVVICAAATHMACVPFGNRVFIPFFGAADLKQFTFVVSGMVGLHHVDYKAQSGDLRSLQAQAMTEAGRPDTSSILHVNAALQRIARLTSGGERSAMSREERDEVTCLSTTFFVPSPLVAFVSSSCLQPTPVMDRGVCAIRFAPPRAQRKAALASAAAAVVRDASGMRSVDGDGVQATAVARLVESNASKSTRAFVQERIVNELVRLVSGGGSVDDVLLSQNADGSFAANCRLYAGLGITEDHFHACKPADANTSTWSTSLACAWLEEAQDPVVVGLAVNALKKGKGHLLANSAESLLNTAKRVLVR